MVDMKVLMLVEKWAFELVDKMVGDLDSLPAADSVTFGVVKLVNLKVAL